MSNAERNSRSGLIKLLERHANRFFALLVAVLSATLFVLGPKIAPSYTDAFVSLATSLFASLVFALIYSGISERYHLMAVKDELSQGIRTAVEELIPQYRHLLPDDHFPPTDQPEKRFNDVLTASLAKSHFYYFKGVTGRHIPGRLSDVRPRNLTCRILLVDPRHDELLSSYIRDRFGAWASDEEKVERLQTVRKEIYMSIVALFDQARRMGIEIWVGLYLCPAFYRTELFNEMVLISYFTEKTATAYPTSYLYREESFFYQTFYIDFQQTHDLATPFITFNARSTEVDLHHFLTGIGCDVNTVPQLRKAANEFTVAFRRALGS